MVLPCPASPPTKSLSDFLKKANEAVSVRRVLILFVIFLMYCVFLEIIAVHLFSVCARQFCECPGGRSIFYEA
jgi:hypothetical protein